MQQDYRLKALYGIAFIASTPGMSPLNNITLLMSIVMFYQRMEFPLFTDLIFAEENATGESKVTLFREVLDKRLYNEFKLDHSWAYHMLMLGMFILLLL